MADNAEQEVVDQEVVELEKSEGEEEVAKSVTAEEPEEECGEVAAEETIETEEGEQMESNEAEKSLSVSDLLKAVEAYEAVEDTLTKSGTNRETFLQARLDSGTITKSEKIELGKIWANEVEVEEAPELAKSVTAQVSDDGGNDLIDASDFLKSLVDGIDGRMDKVEGEIVRDGLATRELMKAQGSLLKGLAGVITQQDDLIKSLVDRIEVVEKTPAPKRAVSTSSGAVVGRGLTKSSIGEANAEDILSKGQIHAGLRSLIQKAGQENNEAAMDRVVQETARFEQTGILSPNMMQEIRQISAS